MEALIINILIAFNGIPFISPPSGFDYDIKTKTDMANGLNQVRYDLHYSQSSPRIFYDRVKTVRTNWENILNKDTLNHMDTYLKEKENIDMLTLLRKSPELKSEIKKEENRKINSLSDLLGDSTLSQNEDKRIIQEFKDLFLKNTKDTKPGRGLNRINKKKK